MTNYVNFKLSKDVEKNPGPTQYNTDHHEVIIIGVRAGGARGAAAPPKFGQLRYFGQQEKTWAKPVFKDVSMFFIIIIIF